MIASTRINIAPDCTDVVFGGRRRDAGAPIVFVATNRLKAGALDAERARVPGLVEFVRDHEPRLIAFNE